LLERKSLRVSTRTRGEQRSSHFLSLPLRIAIPLMCFSGVLHSLVSQSIFLAVIESYSHFNPQTREEGPLIHSSGFDIMMCGWSPAGIVAAIVTGSVLVLFMLGTGRRKLKSEMSVAGNCSAAISAACRGDREKVEDRQSMVTKKLVWGVMQSERCGFSDEDIEGRWIGWSIGRGIYLSRLLRLS
jgi:hypothetical protein